MKTGGRKERAGEHDPYPTPPSSSLITHCVVCNHESRKDFDVCPKCGVKGMAVFVLKKS